ncbi:MAG: hypothetical protein ABH865_09710 [Candidatus Omnitrophota bacterium]
MNPKIREILQKADDPIGSEIPYEDHDKFPWKELSLEINQIKDLLKNKLGLDFECDDGVQDASFFADLRIFHEKTDSLKRIIQIADIAIRFSNFGKLFSLWSNLDGFEVKFPIKEIVNIVKGFNWKYIPKKELHEIYDGKKVSMRNGKYTWWDRFFDYT